MTIIRSRDSALLVDGDDRSGKSVSLAVVSRNRIYGAHLGDNFLS